MAGDAGQGRASINSPKFIANGRSSRNTSARPKVKCSAAAEQRVRLAMMKLLKRHKEGMIGICVPEPLLSLVRHFIMHGKLGDLWKPANGHGRMEILQVEPEEVLVKDNEFRNNAQA